MTSLSDKIKAVREQSGRLLAEYQEQEAREKESRDEEACKCIENAKASISCLAGKFAVENAALPDDMGRWFLEDA